MGSVKVLAATLLLSSEALAKENILQNEFFGKDATKDLLFCGTI